MTVTPSPAAVGPSKPACTCAFDGVHEVALGLLTVMPGARILDLGCYQGAVSRHLVARGQVVSSCDLIEREGVAGLPDFKVADANGALPYADAAFDAIICTEVIEHLENPTNLVREIGRMLRPGGHAVLSMPNVGGLLGRIELALRGELFTFSPYHFENWGHISPITWGCLASTAAKAGMRIDATTSEPLQGGWKRRLAYRVLRPAFWLFARHQPAALLPGTTLIVRMRKGA